MDNDESRPAEPPAMAPPSEMGDLVPQRSRWPTAIAVIGIVLASLGLVATTNSGGRICSSPQRPSRR